MVRASLPRLGPNELKIAIYQVKNVRVTAAGVTAALQAESQA